MWLYIYNYIIQIKNGWQDLMNKSRNVHRKLRNGCRELTGIVKVMKLFFLFFFFIFDFFWRFWILKKIILKSSLAYLLSYYIFSFLKILVIWEEIGDKKLAPHRSAPIRTDPHRSASHSSGRMTSGYDTENENEWHLRVGISNRSWQ